ncbi:hypothetical protein KIW84_071657 [Lathyrus oleraceus]|uniref:Uncharacterized protein n=1 Tax=Pisum sativum TaxID=3888 RepID=A0A9D4VJK9_PEA|nr:hypothetical protein KIW84_071657 [Pisum sativum]
MVVAAVQEDKDKNKNGDDVKDGGVTTSSECIAQCILICMKIKYAKKPLCQDACDPACKQLQGKGLKSLVRRSLNEADDDEMRESQKCVEDEDRRALILLRNSHEIHPEIHLSVDLVMCKA